MTGRRILVAALLAAFVAAWVAPCLMLDEGHAAAMTCREKKGHCDGGTVAQACCHAGQPARRDQDIQPLTPSASVAPIALLQHPWLADARAFAGPVIMPAIDARARGDSIARVRPLLI